MSDGVRVLTLVSALGSGLMASFFFAFSVSVMKALGRLHLRRESQPCNRSTSWLSTRCS